MKTNPVYRFRVFLARFNPKLDPAYSDALALVAKTNNFSISHLQRHLLLGYRRACRIMDAVKADRIRSSVVIQKKR